MALVSFPKQSYEEFPISVDFSEDMDEGETILSQDISATDKDESDATAEILSSPSNDGSTSAIIRVGNGEESLSPYKVTFRVVTSAGNKWEHDVKMKIKEL